MLTSQSTDEEILAEIGPVVVAAFRQHINSPDPLAPPVLKTPDFVAPEPTIKPGEAEADCATLAKEMTFEQAIAELAKTALPLILAAARGGV